MMIRNGRRIGHGGLDLGSAEPKDWVIDTPAWGREASAASHNGTASHNGPRRPSEAFQEGQDAFLMGQAMNPYRRALRAVSHRADRRALEELTQEWDDGFCSTKR